MSSISVRLATLADLDSLSSLFDDYRQFYGRSSDLNAARSFLKERLHHGDSILFIAHEGSAPVGFVHLYPSHSSLSMARIFILNDLFVTHHARRKGVASQLMQSATSFAQSRGAVGLSLSTAMTNSAAQALYHRLGWKRDEEFYVYNYAFEV